jgi:hypothetical protein
VVVAIYSTYTGTGTLSAQGGHGGEPAIAATGATGAAGADGRVFTFQV